MLLLIESLPMWSKNKFKLYLVGKLSLSDKFLNAGSIKLWKMTTVWTIIGDILSFLTISSCLMWVSNGFHELDLNFTLFRSSKFPQILTIYQQKSAVGISLKSLTIEVISYTVSTLYNFTNGYRLMNYFEYVVLIVQDYILVVIVLFYRRQITTKTLVIFFSYALVIALFASGVLPKSILMFLIVSWMLFKIQWMIIFSQPGTLPMSATSKILQLVEIFKTKDSSSISSITWFISAATNFGEVNSVTQWIMTVKIITFSSNLHNHVGLSRHNAFN